MDDEEKPFDIALIVILMIVAIANDVAEIFFDLLDFTGVGLAGEGIMEPINLVLDFFFTGVFVWKTGFGSEVVVQAIDDFLQLFFIPGRTISVGLGIWIANHPKAIVSKVVDEAAVIEGGGEALEAGAGNEVGGMKELGGQTTQETLATEGGSEKLRTDEKRSSRRNSEQQGEENQAVGDEVADEAEKEDIMASEEEGDPTENLQKKLLEPAEDDEDFDQAA